MGGGERQDVSSGQDGDEEVISSQGGVISRRGWLSVNPRKSYARGRKRGGEGLDWERMGN